MPRFNVEYKGLLACFSSVVEDFITPLMSLEAYERWRIKQYGRSGRTPLGHVNVMTMHEAIASMKMNKSHDDVAERLREMGIEEDERE